MGGGGGGGTEHMGIESFWRGGGGDLGPKTLCTKNVMWGGGGPEVDNAKYSDASGVGVDVLPKKGGAEGEVT